MRPPCVSPEGIALHPRPTGIKVSDEELALVNLLREDFHGDWNYTIAPGRRKKLATLF